MTSRETLGERTRTHGMTETRLYSVWCGMKDRCNNPNTEHYDRYGGRGIKVCDEWNFSFEKFRDWAFAEGFDETLTGREQSLDRIDVNGNYEPGNCRWVSRLQQARNRADTVYVVDSTGEKIPAREFAESHNISDYVYVYRKAKAGIEASKILIGWEMLHNMPSDLMTIKQAEHYYGASDVSIRAWIKKGIIKAEKVGQRWYIQKHQDIKRVASHDKNGFFPGG